MPSLSPGDACIVDAGDGKYGGNVEWVSETQAAVFFDPSGNLSIVSLDKLSPIAQDGVMCCICFVSWAKEDLEPFTEEPGHVWDVCKTCATEDKRHGGKY